MNRKERRRVEALLKDRASDAADHAFFARRPGRHYRVRRAFPAEREAVARINHERPGEGEAHFVAVARHRGEFVRVDFFWPRDFETDIGEAVARDLFVYLAASRAWEMPPGVDSAKLVASVAEIIGGGAE